MAENKNNRSTAAKKAGRNKFWRRAAIVAGVIALIAIVLASYFTSSTYYRSKTALEIGDHKITVAEFNYYYRTAVQNMTASIQENYGDYANIVLDPSKPLDEQQYSDTQTWEDYITEVTISNLEDIYATYDEAGSQGFTLSEESRQGVDDVIGQIRDAAKQVNYTTDNYLTAVYGKGVNEKLCRRLLETISIATDYQTEVQNSFTFTDSEIADYYAANSRDIDTVEACIYPLTYDAPDEENPTAGRTEEEAKSIADAVLEIAHTEEAFGEYIASILPEEESADFDVSSIHYDSMRYFSFANVGLGDWLFDDARAEGDIGWVSGDGEYDLVYYVGRSDNDYDTVIMRHILIQPEEDEEGNQVEGALDAARERLDTIYAEWEANGKTEDEFALLANTYSEDGDGTTGGFYEGITHGSMVEPINSWLFDERTPGDYEFLETQYGWHLVYFVGTGENYKAKLLSDAMNEAAYNEWHERVLEGYEAKIDESGFRLTR